MAKSSAKRPPHPTDHESHHHWNATLCIGTQARGILPLSQQVAAAVEQLACKSTAAILTAWQPRKLNVDPARSVVETLGGGLPCRRPAAGGVRFLRIWCTCRSSRPSTTSDSDIATPVAMGHWIPANDCKLRSTWMLPAHKGCYL